MCEHPSSPEMVHLGVAFIAETQQGPKAILSASNIMLRTIVGINKSNILNKAKSVILQDPVLTGLILTDTFIYLKKMGKSIDNFGESLETWHNKNRMTWIVQVTSALHLHF
jgi:hypothetical protein